MSGTPTQSYTLVHNKRDELSNQSVALLTSPRAHHPGVTMTTHVLTSSSPLCFPDLARAAVVDPGTCPDVARYRLSECRVWGSKHRGGEGLVVRHQVVTLSHTSPDRGRQRAEHQTLNCRRLYFVGRGVVSIKHTLIAIHNHQWQGPELWVMDRPG